MRGRKALLNTVAGILYELTAIICAFILPRLILSAFGSDYNGVTSAISQFLGYVSLLRAGIGGVTKAALYKPLAERDSRAISAVVNATYAFLQKVALIFIASLLAFAAAYSLLVINHFDFFFTFTLTLILGIHTFVQYYYGITFQLLLEADQRQCVLSFAQIGTTILNTLVAALLIRLGCSIHTVKLGSAFVFCLNPLLISSYARKYYRIDRTTPPNTKAIENRWDCFGLQVANFINSNTDMLILTAFTNVFEVSVYTVYYMVTAGVQKLIRTVVMSGLGAAFGNMFARNEDETILRNLYLYEQITFVLSNFLFSVTLVMILPFVNLYTAGVTDVNYSRPLFAVLCVLAALFGSYRMPYQSIVEVTGHFRQTRNGAFFEAAMNIALSVVLVRYLGLVGVTIGTLCAAVFRTFQYAIYVSRHLIIRSLRPFFKRLTLSTVDFFLTVRLTALCHLSLPENYSVWIEQAIVVSLISGGVVILTEVLFYLQDLRLLCGKLRNSILKKSR